MGLERIVCVIQDTPTNFETDLFKPLIEATESISGRKYGESEEGDSSFKVIADHMRTVSLRSVTELCRPMREEDTFCAVCCAGL